MILKQLYPDIQPDDNVVFIGLDPRETMAYMVAKHSIQRLSPDVKVIPVYAKTLRQLGLYTRDLGVEGKTGQFIDLVDNRPMSVEFSFTRFLVPHLARLLGIKGWCMFMDCDFLINCDLNYLFDNLKEFNDSKALMVVKHDFTPTTQVKMDGCLQVNYDRKLWSAFMCFNTNHQALDVLTPNLVNNQSGSFLHKLNWINDSNLGAISEDYQFIPGHSDKRGFKPLIVHYTEKAPWFSGSNESKDEYADMWWDELEELKITLCKTPIGTRIWE